MTKTNLTTLGLLLGCALVVGCVKRECTDEEREAAGADGNDDCSVFVPLQEYDGDESERTLAWASGTDLRITGDIRAVQIVEGSADDEVSVRYTAQVDLAQGRERSVVDKTLSHLTTSLRERSGAVEVSASRGESDAALGAAVLIRIPAGFDGDVFVDKSNSLNGDVELDFLGNARNLDVDMNSTGADLVLQAASRLRQVRINTHGDIATSAFAVLHSGVLHTTIGDITVRFSAVPESHVRVVADFGDVSAEVPADGDFTLSGVAERGVSLGSPPDGCLTSSRPSPKTMRCNGGDSDLNFDLEASAEISVAYR